MRMTHLSRNHGHRQGRRPGTVLHRGQLPRLHIIEDCSGELRVSVPGGLLRFLNLSK